MIFVYKCISKLGLNMRQITSFFCFSGRPLSLSLSLRGEVVRSGDLVKATEAEFVVIKPAPELRGVALRRTHTHTAWDGNIAIDDWGG